jgi:cytochrome c oxidase subunit IV
MQDSFSESSNTSHHAALPLPLYFAVFGALLFLTVVTVAVSRLGLPPTASFIVAMAVASVKALFVIGYFMHLKYESRFLSFVFFSTLFFMGLFFILTLTDLTSRGDFQAEHQNFELQRYEGTNGNPLKPQEAK